MCFWVKLWVTIFFILPKVVSQLFHCLLSNRMIIKNTEFVLFTWDILPYIKNNSLSWVGMSLTTFFARMYVKRVKLIVAIWFLCKMYHEGFTSFALGKHNIQVTLQWCQYDVDNHQFTNTEHWPCVITGFAQNCHAMKSCKSKLAWVVMLEPQSACISQLKSFVTLN